MAAPNSLHSLLEDGVIDSVEGQLMSGKEASVYVVSYRGQIVAAKVYKARERRTFKATSSYTEGRNQTRNTRDKRAMGKRTAYGRELMEESWRDMEYRALWDAMQGGVRVPKPIMLYDDVLLMELVVDGDGHPASRLADFEIAPEDAQALHHEIYNQVRMLLATGKVHGDLSAFNILMAQAGPTLIDLPQAVDVAQNNQARDILRRDLQNVTEHLARSDARLLRYRSCGDALWQHYERGTLDQATQPQEGSVRGERAGGGRRAALAESGRMGRGGARQGGAPHGGSQHRQGPERPQHERPQHERPQHDRPQHDRPQHDRPQHARPQHDRPQHERPQHERPQHGRPQHERPQHERTQHGRPQHERPQHERTQHGRPQHDRSQHDRPQHDRPQHGGPREGAPSRAPRQDAPRDRPPPHDRPHREATERAPRHAAPPAQHGRTAGTGGAAQARPRDGGAPREQAPPQSGAQATPRPKGRHDRAPVPVDYVRRSSQKTR